MAAVAEATAAEVAISAEVVATSAAAALTLAAVEVGSISVAAAATSADCGSVVVTSAASTLAECGSAACGSVGWRITRSTPESTPSTAATRSWRRTLCRARTPTRWPDTRFRQPRDTRPWHVRASGVRALGRQAFAHQGFAHNGWHHGHRFNRFGGGWVGPLFWPYAYDDIYDNVFWGYGYDDPFWDYGYGDLYGGMFSPFGYEDLVGYLPGAGSTVASGGRTRRGRSETTASLPSGQPLSGQIAQMCGDDSKEVAGWPIERIQQLIMPTDEQRAALDDLANASVRAAQIIKTACPTSVAFTPTGRLAAMQQRIEAMAQAVDVVRAPLEKFYGALTDEQKAQLNAANQTPEQQNARARGSLAQNCSATNAATQWPGPQIERAVRPNEAQLARLSALQSAAAQAAEQLAASCPSDLPVTPPARLAAVAKRLDVMLQAVKSVRAALGDFYGSLNDEQKAQFNLIGQPRTAQRQG